LAKCNLEVDDRLHVRGKVSTEALHNGFEKLKREVAKNHKASNFWSFSMKRFPEFHNKVWRWDFAPEGDHASTRLGWRVFAYVPQFPGPEPILARAFVCWDKDSEPKNNYIPFLAKVLKKFLVERIEIVTEESAFYDRVDGDGVMHSLCELCCERLSSADHEEIEMMKDVHRQNCLGHPPD
jgi:hypothetical protein